MGNRDRLTKYGIVALAGIAVLGWVREPEKHQSATSNVSATSSSAFVEPRTTFYSKSVGDPLDADYVSGKNPPSVHANDAAPATKSAVASQKSTERTPHGPVELEKRTSSVVETPPQAPASTGRHEDPDAAANDAVTRSREPQQEHSAQQRPEDRHASERPEDGKVPATQEDRSDDASHTKPVLVKKRSTARSAAIILGTAAAGAAIGAATGGGKGAAIGAISGTAGGYVYDRMTRRNSTTGVPSVIDKNSNSASEADEEEENQRHYSGTAFARRFGTPSFTGR